MLMTGVSALSGFFWTEPEEEEPVNDEQAVEEIIQKRYVALNAIFKGKVEPMKAIWSHSDDVTYMGPGGKIRVGWKEVLADWKAQAALKLGGKVIPSDLNINVGTDMAIVVNNERGVNVDQTGKVRSIAIRATHVLRKIKNEWKIVSEHADLLPFLNQ